MTDLSAETAYRTMVLVQVFISPLAVSTSVRGGSCLQIVVRHRELEVSKTQLRGLLFPLAESELTLWEKE